MTDYTFRILKKEEQSLILPLWDCCFPDFWEQLAVNQGAIPYEEISFAAFDGSRPIGHCGVIPYEIWCGSRKFPMAGIASVATDPEYRHRGIAKNLCIQTARWAESRNFASAPLYTAHFRVYESAGWQKLDVPAALTAPAGNGAIWKNGNTLSGDEKAMIAAIYRDSENFDGKVIRKSTGTLHSWERIFAEPDFRFAIQPGMYAIKLDNIIIEINFIPGIIPDRQLKFFTSLGDGDSVDFHLPPTGNNCRLTGRLPCRKSIHDAMHGECPMILELGIKDFHTVNNIFFPVADKF